jgi:hypothetical protein
MSRRDILGIRRLGVDDALVQRIRPLVLVALLREGRVREKYTAISCPESRHRPLALELSIGRCFRLARWAARIIFHASPVAGGGIHDESTRVATSGSIMRRE